jgi:S1-C subfamily serine protease
VRLNLSRRCSNCHQQVQHGFPFAFLTNELSDGSANSRNLRESSSSQYRRKIPASRAALSEGDIIISFADQNVAGIDKLHRLLTAEHIGVALPIEVLPE